MPNKGLNQTEILIPNRGNVHSQPNIPSLKHVGDSLLATKRHQPPPQGHEQTPPMTATVSADHHNNDNPNQLPATTQPP